MITYVLVCVLSILILLCLPDVFNLGGRTADERSAELLLQLSLSHT